MARRGPTLAEQLDQVDIDDDNAIFNLIADADQAIDESVGFRFNSRSTQNREDRHLKLYQEFVTKLWIRHNSPTQEELDEQCFPGEEATLFRRLKTFLYWVIMHMTPRSLASEAVKARSMSQYRSSLVFWTKRKYEERNWIVGTSRLFKNVTEMIQLGLRKRNGMKSGYASQTRQGLVGKYELQQLIDMDIQATACIELAECHHLAWCIARACALRPSSLGRPKTEDRDSSNPYDFLVWEDVTITRTRYLLSNRSPRCTDG